MGGRIISNFNDMILTGKAKKDFESWLQNRNCNLFDMIRHRNIDKLVVSAYIIEWLDSVDIHLSITKTELGFHYNFNNRIFIRDNNFKSRQEATERGIVTANAIYNENN